MQKYKNIIPLIVIVLMVLMGCTPKTTTEGPDHTKLAENQFADYTFYYPDDWTLDSNTTFISVIGGSSPLYPEDKSISVMVSDLLDTKTTPQEFWTMSKKLLGETFDIEEGTGKAIKVANLDAYTVEYTAKITDKEYKFAQTFVVRRGAVYIITFTATELDFDGAYKSYSTVLETFSFK